MGMQWGQGVTEDDDSPGRKEKESGFWPWVNRDISLVLEKLHMYVVILCIGVSACLS